MLNHRPSNQLLVPGIEKKLEEMKVEIAEEFGVQVGSNSSARTNGHVGGEMTKRLIENAQEQKRARERKS